MTGDTTSKAPAASEQGSAYEELQNARMHIEILQRQLHQALEAHRASSAEIARLHTIERDRDKYRATVLSLAFQNKVLNDELSKTRKVSTMSLIGETSGSRHRRRFCSNQPMHTGPGRQGRAVLRRETDQCRPQGDACDPRPRDRGASGRARARPHNRHGIAGGLPTNAGRL